MFLTFTHHKSSKWGSCQKSKNTHTVIKWWWDWWWWGYLGWNKMTMVCRLRDMGSAPLSVGYARISSRNQIKNYRRHLFQPPQYFWVLLGTHDYWWVILDTCEYSMCWAKVFSYNQVKNCAQFKRWRPWLFSPLYIKSWNISITQPTKLSTPSSDWTVV